MKVLITGGAGFIGSYLTNLLYEKGNEVFIIDNFNPQIHGDNKEKSYLYGKIFNKARIFSKDILACEQLDELISQNDYIVHLAAETGTGQSMYNISNYVRTNTLGTAIILEKLIKKKNTIKKFILASSRAVYGEGKYLCAIDGVVYPAIRYSEDILRGEFDCKCPICNGKVIVQPTDEKSNINPLSIYGLTKLNQEQLVTQVCNSIQLPYTIFRFQNVYGKGQSLKNPYTGILAIFSQLMLEGKQIDVFEDGNESRDFIHVKDVASVIEAEIFSTNANRIFNIGMGKSTSVLDIVNMLSNAFNVRVDYKISRSFRAGDIRHNVADITEAKRLLNFNPLIKIEDGIKEFAQWVNEQNIHNTKHSFENSIEEMKRYGLFYGREK